MGPEVGEKVLWAAGAMPTGFNRSMSHGLVLCRVSPEHTSLVSWYRHFQKDPFTTGLVHARQMRNTRSSCFLSDLRYSTKGVALALTPFSTGDTCGHFGRFGPRGNEGYVPYRRANRMCLPMPAQSPRERRTERGNNDIQSLN